jgi:hypothetical protein
MVAAAAEVAQHVPEYVLVSEPAVRAAMVQIQEPMLAEAEAAKAVLVPTPVLVVMV